MAAATHDRHWFTGWKLTQKMTALRSHPLNFVLIFKSTRLRSKFRTFRPYSFNLDYHAKCVHVKENLYVYYKRMSWRFIYCDCVFVQWCKFNSTHYTPATEWNITLPVTCVFILSSFIQFHSFDHAFLPVTFSDSFVIYIIIRYDCVCWFVRFECGCLCVFVMAKQHFQSNLKSHRLWYTHRVHSNHHIVWQMM